MHTGECKGVCAAPWHLKFNMHRANTMLGQQMRGCKGTRLDNPWGAIDFKYGDEAHLFEQWPAVSSVACHSVGAPVFQLSSFVQFSAAPPHSWCLPHPNALPHADPTPASPEPCQDQLGVRNEEAGADPWVQEASMMELGFEGWPGNCWWPFWCPIEAVSACPRLPQPVHRVNQGVSKSIERGLAWFGQKVGWGGQKCSGHI